MGKYTEHGDEELEARLDSLLERIRERALSVPSAKSIAGLVLGGGYGRGEGGVFESSDGVARLYNDLDIFVISKGAGRGRRRKLDTELKSLCHDLSSEAGVDVDFGPAMDAGALSSMPLTLMWQELREGHRVLYGGDALLSSIPELPSSLLPVAEGGRLLMNRGTGLWLAARRLESGVNDVEDMDFVARNIWKGILGGGDAMLLAAGEYRYGARGRLKALEGILRGRDMELYREALEFKFSPRRYPVRELPEMHAAALVFFRRAYLEFSRRVFGAEVDSIGAAQRRAYLGSLPGEELSGGVLRNILANILELGIKAADRHLWFRHPRARLFVFFPCLLFGSEAEMNYITLLPGCGVDTPDTEVSAAYLRLWNRFN